MEIYEPTTTNLKKTYKPTWSQQTTYWITQNWIVVFTIVMSLYVGLAFLAPIFMHMGWTGLAKIIYWFYSFQCHQLPQRSFFLFGPKVMYSLNEIQANWQDSLNPMVLRQFIGNPEMGWKVAWSDRMVFMYTGILVLGLLWWPLRRRIKPLPWWGFILLLLPMFLDGTSHILSDLAGLGQGFRYNNLWFSNLTNNAFPQTFYSGNALGSFNSWMRLISGVLFGVGTVWFGLPYVNEWFNETTKTIAAKSKREAIKPW